MSNNNEDLFIEENSENPDKRNDAEHEIVVEDDTTTNETVKDDTVVTETTENVKMIQMPEEMGLWIKALYDAAQKGGIPPPGTGTIDTKSSVDGAYTVSKKVVKAAGGIPPRQTPHRASVKEIIPGTPKYSTTNPLNGNLNPMGTPASYMNVEGQSSTNLEHDHQAQGSSEDEDITRDRTKRRRNLRKTRRGKERHLRHPPHQAPIAHPKERRRRRVKEESDR